MASAPKISGNGKNDILKDIMLHSARQELEKTRQELKAAKEEHASHSKKHEMDKALHEETRKELHKLKLQYDPNYVVEQKLTKQDAMKRARLAKSSVTKAKKKPLPKKKP